MLSGHLDGFIKKKFVERNTFCLTQKGENVQKMDTWNQWVNINNLFFVKKMVYGVPKSETLWTSLKLKFKFESN